MSIKLNLDQLAAQHAQQIIKNAAPSVGEKGIKEAKAADVLITKALGVLQENGVYACMLFLFSRTREEDKKVAQAVRSELLVELRELNDKLHFGWQIPNSSNDPAIVLKFYSDTITANLDELLLVKELYEQTLTYARYGAKARAESGG
ncbi:MAG: hypothetical protein ONB05_03895 [candidate division KSB1 bacterium]|nr:hypothetical protein [candidate division KSB1 bacterium]